jgi:hypothetical protein
MPVSPRCWRKIPAQLAFGLSFRFLLSCCGAQRNRLFYARIEAIFRRPHTTVTPFIRIRQASLRSWEVAMAFRVLIREIIQFAGGDNERQNATQIH